MVKGLFITFEGGEGSGKTSLIREIEADLVSRGYQVIVTREPGGIKIAEDIRNILLDRENVMMDPLTEVLLFAASRREHLVNRIIPNLDNGFIILCDRFIDSSLAYQAYARGIDFDSVYSINRKVVGEYMPDLTIFVDCPPQIGLRRISGNATREVNRLDLEELNFHNKVYDGYKKLVEQFSDRIIPIDGTKTLDLVTIDALEIINNKLNESKNY